MKPILNRPVSPEQRKNIDQCEALRPIIDGWGCDLASYAAADSVRYLLRNWKDNAYDAADFDLPKLVAGDIDAVIQSLTELKAKLL